MVEINLENESPGNFSVDAYKIDYGQGNSYKFYGSVLYKKTKNAKVCLISIPKRDKKVLVLVYKKIALEISVDYSFYKKIIKNENIFEKTIDLIIKLFFDSTEESQIKNILIELKEIGGGIYGCSLNENLLGISRFNAEILFYCFNIENKDHKFNTFINSEYRKKELLKKSLYKEI